MHSKKFYYFSAFVSGLVVMAVEMSASRLLAPYFGSSLFVWTNVIGVVMISLALGYFFGGRFADRNPNPRAYFFLMMFSGIWIVSIPFLSRLLMPFLFASFSDLSQLLFFGSLISIVLFLATPMFFLGMMVPFTLKLVSKIYSELGRDSGRVSAISTLGSIFGTFLPAFFLIPQFGLIRSFIILGLLLLFLAALGLRSIFSALLFLLMTPLLFLNWGSFFFNSGLSFVHEESSPYGEIFVSEDAYGVRYLHMDTFWGVQSVYDPNSPNDTFAYYPYVASLPAFLDDPKNVLILGNGGGTFTRFFLLYYPEMQITAVELDPQVSQVAETYMGFDSSQINLVSTDARVFLETTQQKYDLILIDAYRGTSIPSHLATSEFFALVKEHLQPEGLLAINAASIESEFLDRFKNTIAFYFEDLGEVQIPNFYNELILASDDLDLETKKLPVELEPYAQTIIKEASQKTIFSEPIGVFLDDYLTEVELLSEKMQMQILSELSF